MINQTLLPTIIVAIVAVLGSAATIVSSFLVAHNNTVNQKAMLKIEKMRGIKSMQEERIKLIRNSYIDFMGHYGKIYNLMGVQERLGKEKNISEDDRQTRISEIEGQIVKAQGDLLASRVALQIEVDEEIAVIIGAVYRHGANAFGREYGESVDLRRAITQYLRQQEESIRALDYKI